MATKTATNGKRPLAGVPEEELRARLTEIDAERRAMRSKPAKFKADAHAAIDEIVEGARRQVDATLRDGVVDIVMRGARRVPQIGDAFLISTVPQIAERWHSVVDGVWPANEGDPLRRDTDREQYTAALRGLAMEERRVEVELGMRDAEARKAAAEKELEEVAT